MTARRSASNGNALNRLSLNSAAARAVSRARAGGVECPAVNLPETIFFRVENPLRNKEVTVFRPSFRAATLALVAAAALCALHVTVSAQRRAAPAPKRAADAARHSKEAAEVLRKIMSVPEKEIPRDLLESAEAVAVCPGVLKAAFIVGGRKGDCVISRRW